MVKCFWGGLAIMDLSQLQQLVRNFIENTLDYPSFRAEFVLNFLCAQHADAVMEDLVNEIEGICADFDEGDIVEPELRSELSVVANAPIASIEFSGQSKTHLPISVVSGKPSRSQFIRESGSINEVSLVFSEGIHA